jgi:preprotein translocase subunit YajC
MKTFDLNALLAQAGPGPQMNPNPKAQMFQLAGTMLILGGMFYFLLIRPQRKQASDLAKLLQNLKAGDKIVTNSGIVGVVVSVKDKTVAIRSVDSKMEMLKSAISQVLEAAGEAAETKP